MEAEEAASFNHSLLKGLASCNAKTRTKSINSLLNWLSSQTLISDDEFKKLWKALFYCMWHCDKIENQIHLINRLSTLLPNLPFPVSLSYFSHFLLTMRREWPGIDRLRLDKFYLLVRSFVRNFFVLLKNTNWDLSTLEDFVRVLEKDSILYVGDNDGKKGDNGLGNGVSYHIVSVFCDELKPFLPLRLEVLNFLLRPFLGVLCKSDNKVLVNKVKCNVFDYLIKNGKGLLSVKKLEESEVDQKTEVFLFGTIALGLGFASRLFELGSSVDCVQGNRKVVFSLHEEFLKLEKEKVLLGFDVSLPEVVDEVPNLIRINGDFNEAGHSMKMNGVVAGELSDVKSKESKKGSKENKTKKKKKKKKGVNNSGGVTENDSSCDSEMVSVDNNSNVEGQDGVDGIELNETLISNLQQQFEKIAAESGLDGDGVSAIESPATVQVKDKSTKKRKRSKSVPVADMTSQNDVNKEEAAPNTEDKSGKRVRFVMKNNIVWKPHNPLPPQSVRIPPSSTPRGSALKKGLSPGPIRDTTQETKKAKKKKPSPLKRAKKVKSVSPSVKRVKKKVMPMSS
ncbi:uncharacterized protein LOC130814796 [Amaranthus tricolor]|uniref:uncharacterized protein LOC130814796 n=1 Tax=Amaranthus tricolor TaxID=29722 RepID=UPI00258CF1DE|nr:uncharacterized protein LOC130814796 [Amaranthus tricolor]